MKQLQFRYHRAVPDLFPIMMNACTINAPRFERLLGLRLIPGPEWKS